jgi:uncharacterized protein (TIGR02145 family)
MALIKCPECGTEVSERANTCVKCGCPISNAADSTALFSPVSDDSDLDDEFKIPTFWEKHKKNLIVIAVFLLIAAIANPSQRKHRATVAAFLIKEFTEKAPYEPLVLRTFVNRIAESVERQNLIFLSLTKTREDVTIGMGAFGHVWMSIDYSESLQQWKEYCKSLQEFDEAQKKLEKELNSFEKEFNSLIENEFNTNYGNGTMPTAQPAQTSAAQTGTFTDSRDGKVYKTVKIGTQTWMAENLNYQTNSGSWCYENKINNCNKYGRLYDWKTATTVCPTGWKLPSNQEWERLVATAGGGFVACDKLKAKRGWDEGGNGTDDFGFSAMPGGSYGYGGTFEEAGETGGWWTSTTGDRSDVAYLRYMGYDLMGNACQPDMCYSPIVQEMNYPKEYGYSVRCVKN